uniref:Uncharacterized protein n=1 Tax=Salix viminalis TaxID=40686 RepID=A0A6N2NKB5_SALVM
MVKVVCFSWHLIYSSSVVPAAARGRFLKRACLEKGSFPNFCTHKVGGLMTYASGQIYHLWPLQSSRDK